MKILFLDIDGVLNCKYTKESFAGYAFVSDDKIRLLKKIIEATDAQIVLSSSWREGWFYKDHAPHTSNTELDLFEALWDKLLEFDIEMLDYTAEYGHRGMEIDAWLKGCYNENIESYVILDDMDESELRPHSSHLVQTDFSEGLTEKHVIMAIEMLNEK